MILPTNNSIYIKYLIVIVWLCNCILGLLVSIRQSWIPYMNAGYTTYTDIQSDPFDGTIMPILYIPDWNKIQYQNKNILFTDIPINDYIPIPQYDAKFLLDTGNTSNKSLIFHYTYITPYMGSYRLNYKEYDGSHNAVDIRAPTGTPVLAIANGVVVRTIEVDNTGNKYIVIRHNNIPINGKKQNLYSGYLHLSEITIQEGVKVKKGDMIGRVGMTGIATTPHLHIQIDTEDAPFHPYWPFSSTDSRSVGLGFFDSVNAGLGKENALRYSIHPMTFINSFLGGVTSNNSIIELQSAPSKTGEIHELIPVNASVESIIANMNNSNATSKTTIVTKPIESNTSGVTLKKCEKKRFSDISSSNKAGKILYELVDSRCMFQGINSFDPHSTITQKDAIMMLMDYYKVSPTNGTSHFLDIDIGDNFQGYAIAGYRRGIIDGNYALPGKLLTKEDFVELIVKIGKLERNPSQIKIYRDTSPMNFKFQYIQDYAFRIRARGGNFNPQSLLSREGAIELLGNIIIRDQSKK